MRVVTNSLALWHEQLRVPNIKCYRNFVARLLTKQLIIPFDFSNE